MNTENNNSTSILNISNLSVSFMTDEGAVKAVDGVDFSVDRGKTLGIVGESGSGKSVTNQAVMRILPKNAVIGKDSQITFRTRKNDIINITDLDAKDPGMKEIRGGEIAMIFQEPMASFSPVYTIGHHITEAVMHHSDMTKNEAREIGVDLLARVGISNPAVRFKQYPFELSGGMRQRAMIAVALSTNPSLLIADEPTTALDVTIQAQILELIKEIQDEMNMANIFITHNLGVIAQIADEIAVMYLGRIMESGKTREIIKNPQHPYTKGLLNAIPRLDELDKRLVSVPGDIPGPLERPEGCLFHTRCEHAIKGKCDVETPGKISLTQTHGVCCFLHNK